MKKKIKKKTIQEVELEAYDMILKGWKKISLTMTGHSILRGIYYYIILEKNGQTN